MRERVVAAILVAVGLACAAFPERAGALLLHGVASRAASARVDAALDRNQDSFLALSAAKAAVAVVEGSSVGVGFDLQLGDVVQPVFDLVDFFWKLLLWSLLLLGTYKLLMETGILSLGFSALGVALVLWGVSLLEPRWRTRLQALARVVALAGLLFAYLVPLALLTTDWVAATYMGELQERYRADIAVFGRDLGEVRASVIDPEKTPPWYRPGERIEDFRERLSSAAAYVAARLEETLPSITFYGILLLFEYLLLPFASAWLLYRLVAHLFARLGPAR